MSQRHRALPLRVTRVRNVEFHVRLAGDRCAKVEQSVGEKGAVEVVRAHRHGIVGAVLDVDEGVVGLGVEGGGGGSALQPGPV